MSIKLMYITNNPEIAVIAENCGVDSIWVDLEVLGKEERQQSMNTVKSYHTIEDVGTISKVLKKSEMLVRINSWNPNSEEEIEQVIAAGAQRIMLPMWKTPEEVGRFLKQVNRRVNTTLLLETKEAVECLDEVLKNPLLDEIHIGLNDLHLSYGMNFMFEPLANGCVEELCKKMKRAGIRYGFGGVARLGKGIIPAEMVIMEHYRLGSQRAILSRSFCNASEAEDIGQIEGIFKAEMEKLRSFEQSLSSYTPEMFEENRKAIKAMIEEVARSIKTKK
ncbi:MAG: aldolase [Firmicutes bacterium]|nr:aldolase [Bacillota bacterium]